MDPSLSLLLQSRGGADAGLWPSSRELYLGVVRGDRACLARAITLVESSRDDHRRQAELLLDAVVQARAAHAGGGGAETVAYAGVPAGRAAAAAAAATAMAGSESAVAAHGEELLSGHPLPPRARARFPPPPTFRLGIAGPPGAGKSTLIEALGLHALGLGHRVAVVAVDPSSSRAGGSILGDKTRMPRLSISPAAYVRPSPTRGALGGLAEHTNDVILLCEGCGFDVVLVETVGLGQSETVVDAAVDMTLLVVPPGGGDELQGVKKGIVEVADAVVVNKADGALAGPARHAAAEYTRALQLVRPKHGGGLWAPPVLRASALTGAGVPEVWAMCDAFREATGGAGLTQARRSTQAAQWMWAGLADRLQASARECSDVRAAAARLAQPLAAGAITPRAAAHDLAAVYLRAAARAVMAEG